MIKTWPSKNRIGNKAKHLFSLKALGHNVPKFIVISYDDLSLLLNNNEHNKTNVESCEIPNTWLKEIEDEFPNVSSFAVRSSTDVEDSANKSYAGQFKSKLNVQKHQLLEAVKEVWLSVFSEHIQSYNSVNNENIAISIIIQECVEAHSSGVVFTMNPITGDKDCMMINSTYGLGEGLVSGALDADTYLIKNNEITETIASKNTQFLYGDNGDLTKKEVNEKNRLLSSINSQNIIELTEIGQKLFQHFGHHQDIEFCIKNDQIYLLQSRPITTITQNKDYLIWDNSNIIESYPGITLPLTFSFISPVYSAVYQQMSSILGISKRDIQNNLYTYDNMLGLLKGRVYYNLYSWYKLLSLLPGYSLNAEFMEKMMGVNEKFELKDYQKPNGVIEKLSVLKLAFSMIFNAILLPKMKRDFSNNFNSTIKKHQSKAIHQADAITCMHAYYQFENTLSKEWKAPLVNDLFAMIYYGLFQKLIDKYSNGNSNNEFLIHTGKVITTEPAILQNKISIHIQNNKELIDIFENKSIEVIWEWIIKNPNETISKLIQEYLDKWGNRCFAELKLETITYTQNPLLFIKIIKNTYASASRSKGNYKQTNTIKLNLNFLQNFLFNFIKRNAINTVTDRENLRFDRTRAFAEVRLIFTRIGLLFEQEKHISKSRDIFYLSKEEIFNFIKGTSFQLDLKSLIELRKKEYNIYIKEPSQKSRIKTNGIVYSHHFGSEISENTKLLKGIGCCPGIVKAEVKIVHSPDDIENLKDKILVTISTDPGWVSVFPLVKGILVQRGSVLSHAAIVSREMNIPCIVGIANITNHLKDGQIIEMNGLTGEIIL
ncbi:MAG: phosphoenolpyruvate synthase [Bacteroidetes bacterium]|nr:MAG: phosphoenolpyruvate synthase [Bacteroidota bacterium]